MEKIKNRDYQFGIRMARNIFHNHNVFYGWHLVISFGMITFVTGKSENVFDLIDEVDN